MTKEKIVELLKDYNQDDVHKFASYAIRLKIEKDKRSGGLKNFWIQGKDSAQMAELFKRVANDGLVFDGEHITLQSTGISYDYVAYKNKMFIAYPESTMDVSLVNEGDDFAFRKINGKVEYTHVISSPFKKGELIGAYCIIKNKRGEFITLLNKEDIDKHRKVAKTDFIWRQWFDEMALKTVIKKACKQHFSDIFQEIERKDNENYELENPLDIDLKMKGAIDKLKTKKELQDYYKKNKGAVGLDKYITIKTKQLNGK